MDIDVCDPSATSWTMDHRIVRIAEFNSEIRKPNQDCVQKREISEISSSVIPIRKSVVVDLNCGLLRRGNIVLLGEHEN
jgi:hypothetical protein